MIKLDKTIRSREIPIKSWLI